MTRWVYILQEVAGITTTLAESRARLAELVGAANIEAERHVDNAFHFALNQTGIERFRSGPAKAEGWVEHDRADPWASTAAPAAAAGLPKWLPWLLLAVLALLAILAFRSCGGPKVDAPKVETAAIEAPPAPDLPALPTIELPQPASTGLKGYLEGNEPTPRRFILDNLNYETDSARLAPDARDVVGAIVVILKEHPTSRVGVVGYTDAEGDDAANLKLSQDRAASVAAALQAQGIAADRIEARGLGEADPIASNETAEGKAQNRRTELVVLAR